MRVGKRLIAATATAGLLGLALTGCGAGRDALSAYNEPAIHGVNANATDDSVLVRNAYVEFSEQGYPRGGTAPVRLWLVNDTTDPVRLVEATTDQAAAVVVDPAATIPARGYLETTLDISGLQRQIGGDTANQDAVTPLPMTLLFDNGAEVTLQLSMATPLEPQPRAEVDMTGSARPAA